MRLRTKIFLYFGSIVLFSIVTYLTLNYLLIERALHDNARKQLKQMADSVSLAADTVLTGAVRSYLRGVIDQDVRLLEELDKQVKSGELTREEAEEAFQEHALTETIGATGYIVAVEMQGDRAELAIHPHMRGRDCTETRGCQVWVERRSGYVEYPWKNPEDESFRQKVAYMHLFESWNWVVGATSYKDEFTELVRVDDLRDLVEPVKVLEQGYFYVMDENFQMLIHPEREGDNLADAVNEQGLQIGLETARHVDDFFYYSWRNPSEDEPRDKFIYVTKLEHLGWYVCASGYLEDIDAPIRKVMFVSYAAIVLVAAVLFALTAFFSRSLTRPLRSFIEGLRAFQRERRVFRVPFRSVSELDSVGEAIENLTEELVAAEDENRALLAQLDGIVESMPSLIVGTDEDARVVVWNRTAEELTGLSREAAEGKQLSEAIADFAAVLEPVQRSISEGRSYSGTCTVAKDEGDESHYEVTLFPMRAGRLNAVLRIDDISERVEMSEKLTRRRKMEALGTLAGGIAHDFNNILAAILGYGELVLMGLPQEEESHEMQSQVLQAADRARELVRQILLFSRQTRQDARPVRLSTVLDEVLSLLRSSIPSTIEIRAKLDTRTGTVLADPIQMHQVAMNLCTNAYQAMRGEGGVLAVSVSSSRGPAGDGTLARPDRYVQLVVSDTGHGMDAATREKIFDPFFTTKSAGEGTGMGLSVVLGIVESLGGNIEVDSELGRGTTVRVYLPCNDQPAQSAPQPSPAPSLPTGRERLLVVDDEPGVLEVTRRRLRRLGYDVSAYEDSGQALAAFLADSSGFDLVISDLTMPHLSGRDLSRKILAARADTPIIVCSGFSDQLTSDGADELGIAAYLHKPVHLADLARVVREVLDRG